MNAFAGELIGTAILILFGCGVNANVNLKGTYAKGSDWIVIAVGWGLAVVMGVYAVGSITGAHLNPAVTIGMAVDGSLPWNQVLPYFAGQMIGGVLGAALVWFQFMPHFKEEDDAGTKLGVFATGPAYPNYVSNFVSEIIGTSILVMALLFIGGNKFSEGLNPLVVGLLIIAIGVSLGGTTGYAINPARDWGPRIAHTILPIPGKGSSNWKYAVVPMVGPMVGGVFGATLFHVLFKEDQYMLFGLSIALIVATLVLGVFLNKAVLKNEKTDLI